MTPDELDHTPLTFGKHRGKTPDEIAEFEPSYIRWLAENVNPPVVSELLAQACAQDDEGPGEPRSWSDYRRGDD